MKKDNPIVAIQLFSDPETSNELYEVISADAVIVRADYLEKDDSLKRISLANGVKIFSLRSKREGGKFEGRPDQRFARLLEALNDYDLIELEAETDLTSEMLRMIPPERRLISWYGNADSFEDIEDRYNHLLTFDARYYQIVVDPRTISEGIWPLQLLKKRSNEKLISYASGAIGVWTQLLSVYMGSSMISGKINKDDGNEFFLTYDQLKNEYNLPIIRKVKRVFGIAGNPVFTSLSPLIHNKCYESLDMDALYLPFHVEQFEHFWKLISSDFPASDLGIEMGGFTMVSPFKEDTFRAVKEHLSAPTLLSKACNILINNNGDWCSDSSDGLGVLAVLEEENINLKQRRIAIIGCGGAGRTIASRLKDEGAEIVMYNRSKNRGEFASDLLGLPFRPITEFDAFAYDIVINATPVGKLGKRLIFDPAGLGYDSLTIDMAYTKKDTLLVSGCRRHGKNIIEGKHILLHQVKKQFTGLTSKEMPLEVELMVREKTANLLKMN